MQPVISTSTKVESELCSTSLEPVTKWPWKATILVHLHIITSVISCSLVVVRQDLICLSNVSKLCFRLLHSQPLGLCFVRMILPGHVPI